jgi:hypothetical protein
MLLPCGLIVGWDRHLRLDDARRKAALRDNAEVVYRGRVAQ